MTQGYNQINKTQFKGLRKLLPKDFDVYEFDFDKKYCILRTINRSHTVYLNIEISPVLFNVYQIAYPNKVVLHQLEIKQNNFNFNDHPTKYSEGVFEQHKSLDESFKGRKYCLTRINEITKALKAYEHTFATMLIQNNGFEAMFDMDLIRKAILPYPRTDHILIGLECEDSNVCIIYQHSEHIKVNAMVAPKFIPHKNYDYRIKDCYKMLNEIKEGGL